MNKVEFLKILRKNLKSVDRKTADEIIDEYENHFYMSEEKGRSEDETCRMLGDPAAIAREYSAEYSIENAQKKPNHINTVKAAFAVASTGFYSIFILIPIYLCMIALNFAFFTAAFAIVFAGVAGIIITIVQALGAGQYLLLPVGNAAVIFAMAGLIAMGVLIYIGSVAFSKRVVSLFMKFIKSSFERIEGRRQYE